MVEATLHRDQARRERGRARVLKHKLAAGAARFTSLDFLGTNTVRPGTHEQYVRARRTFEQWTRDQKIVMKSVDNQLVLFLEHLYFDGAISSEGSTMLAALE